MNALLVPRYLFGSRTAIMEIAESRSSIYYGAVFVVGAGLAREYDGKDLWHEPWHILAPMGASIVAGTLLFLLVHTIALANEHRSLGKTPALGSAYRRFMSLFWMTAPLAWLYAVPYERFLTPLEAIEMNLWTLAVVSAWRVGLITRAISVIYGVNPIAVFFIVMLFADAVAGVGAMYAPVPIVDLMGGLQRSPEDELLAGVTFSVLVLAILTAPVWIVGALGSLYFFKPRWPEQAIDTSRNQRSLIITAAVLFLIPTAAACVTQPEQFKKHEAQTLLRQDRVAQALAVMSRHRRSEYPPIWDPPPRIGYAEQFPTSSQIEDAMINQWPADWVAEIYLDKIRRRVFQAIVGYRDPTWQVVADIDTSPDDVMQRFRAQRSSIEFLYRHDPTLTDADRTIIDELLQKIAPPESDAGDDQ